MKKIFTFILLAISTLAMAQAFPTEPGNFRAAAADSYKRDTITLAVTGVTGRRGAAFSGKKANNGSNNTYEGYVTPSNGVMNFNGSCYILNSTTNGTIRSITVVWDESKNNEGSYIDVFSSNNKFPDAEYQKSGISLEAEEIEYDGSEEQTIDIAAKENKYIYIMGSGYIESLIIEWDVWVEHTITTSFNPDEGEVTVSKNRATKGTTITVEVIGNLYEEDGTEIEYEPTVVTAAGKELTVTDIEQGYIYHYSFTMGNEDVIVAASFRIKPNRSNNNIYYTEQSEFTSGDTYTCNFTTTAGAGYFNDAANAKITITSSNKDVLEVTSTNPKAGKFTIKAYNRGTATINITTAQTDAWEARSKNFIFTVTPKRVALVATDDQGVSHALKADNGDNFTGTSIFSFTWEDNTYVADEINNVVWDICEHRDGGYSIQRTDGKFLGYNKKLLYGNTYEFATSWDKDAQGQYTWQDLISISCIDGVFGKNTGMNYGVKDVMESDLQKTIQELLPRNLAQDKFNTVCMDKAFVCPNADVHFYSLSCMEHNGGKYNFNFEEEDFTTTPSIAGRPYIVKATDADHSKNLPLYTIGEAATEFENANGLIGMKERTAVSNLPDYTDSKGLLNILVFYEGELTFAKSGNIAANSAYMQFQDIPNCDEVVSNAAARRVVLEVEQQEAPGVATGVENLSADQINWNEPVYNIMGQRVARGTTGVLIQNGQKFIAE